MCDNFEYWNTTNCIECAPNQKIYGSNKTADCIKVGIRQC